MQERCNETALSVEETKQTNKMRQRYLSRNETRVVKTMGRQNEFKKNKQYRGIVRTTRIFADQ